jgi:hypothetical protein
MMKCSFSMIAIALSLITLTACEKPKAATSSQSEATPTAPNKVINQREDAAKQQANKLEQKRDQVQQSVMQSEQTVNEAETQAR